MKKINLENVQEERNDRLPAGGYICKYTKVEDVEEKEYLLMEYDIAKGDYAGYYSSLQESFGFWGGKCYRSYKEKALPMFKRMCSAVSKSNNGFVFDGNTNADEQTLVGKLVGIVLGEEEYIANNGEVKTRLYVYRECSVEDIANGKYKVPALKKLKDEDGTASASTEGFMEMPKSEGTDVPFKSPF